MPLLATVSSYGTLEGPILMQLQLESLSSKTPCINGSLKESFLLLGEPSAFASIVKCCRVNRTKEGSDPDWLPRLSSRDCPAGNVASTGI